MRVRLPKDQPRALEEDPCSLRQHLLEVSINGTVDIPCGDLRIFISTIVPHVGLLRNLLGRTAYKVTTEVQATICVWIDRALMTMPSHTKFINEDPYLDGLLMDQRMCTTEAVLVR